MSARRRTDHEPLVTIGDLIEIVWLLACLIAGLYWLASLFL
jgi:hypothetical protein